MLNNFMVKSCGYQKGIAIREYKAIIKICNRFYKKISKIK